MSASDDARLAAAARLDAVLRPLIALGLQADEEEPSRASENAETLREKEAVVP